MTPTLNLTSRQLTNAKIAIGAGNAVYDLNRGGQSLIVGLPLVYTSDVAGSSYGNKYGYSALPDTAPPGFIVTQVRNDASSGLNMFVAYNKDTNTAIVGIAGINGIFANGVGSAADNAQIVSGFKGQMEAMFKGSRDNLSPGILTELTNLATDGKQSGIPFSVIIGGQSGAGASVDALTASLSGGLSDTAKVQFGLTDVVTALPDRALLASNIFVNKVNTVGSEYALRSLEMWDKGLALQEAGATITTINAGDTSRNFKDMVPSLLGKQFGNMVYLDVAYPTNAPQSMGDVLVWFHRNEGALASYLKQDGDLNTLPIVEQKPLDIESLAAAMNVLSGIKWDSNFAAYGAKCAHPLEKVKRADSPSEGAQQLPYFVGFTL